MAVNKTQLIEMRLREWSRDYFKLNRPASAGAAPVLQPVRDGQGLSFEYQVVNSNGAMLAGDVPNLTSETQNLTDVSISLDTENFILDQIDLGVFRISDSTADAFTTQAGSGGSAADAFMETLMSRAYRVHSIRTRAAAIDQLPFESLNVESESFKEDLDEILLRVQLRSGYVPNTILLSKADAVKLSQRNFVRDFPAISIITAESARTGHANLNHVRTYLRDAHDLELVVEDTSIGDGTDNTWVWDGAGVLTYNAGGGGEGRQSTMNTMVQYSGELARYEVRRNSGNQRIGFSAASEGIFKIHARQPRTGCVFATDGASSFSS